MDIRVGQLVVHYVEHGTGRPVLVLHGAGVDHREAEACFEQVLDADAGLRRIYPDLPGMGWTIAPEGLRSADDALDTLLEFANEVTGGTPHFLIGHSAGAYYAQAMAARRSAQVGGLTLVCPLLPGVRNVPAHRVVAGSSEIGDDVFRSYFRGHGRTRVSERARQAVPPSRSHRWWGNGLVDIWADADAHVTGATCRGPAVNAGATQLFPVDDGATGSVNIPLDGHSAGEVTPLNAWFDVDVMPDRQGGQL
jgi:pimeloyl-ACP methyl ester carboxylesterase